MSKITSDEIRILSRSLKFADLAIDVAKRQADADAISFYLMAEDGVVGLTGLPFIDIPETIRENTDPADVYSLAIRMFVMALQPFHVLTIATALEVDQCPKCGSHLHTDAEAYEDATCSSCGSANFGSITENPYHREQLIAAMHMRDCDKAISWQYRVIRDATDQITGYETVSEHRIAKIGGKLSDFWNPFAIAPWMVPQLLNNVPLIQKAFGKRDRERERTIAALIQPICSAMPEVPILQIKPELLSEVKSRLDGGIDPTVN